MPGQVPNFDRSLCRTERHDPAAIRAERNALHRRDMAAETNLFHAAIQVPDADGAVGPSFGQKTTIGTEGNAQDRAGIGSQALDDLSSFQLPDLDVSVAARRNQK